MYNYNTFTTVSLFLGLLHVVIMSTVLYCTHI